MVKVIETANIWIFNNILLLVGEYIHLLKNSWIFSKQIYSDIYFRLFSPDEDTQTFIRTVKFKQIDSNVFAQQNKSCNTTNFR